MFDGKSVTRELAPAVDAALDLDLNSLSQDELIDVVMALETQTGRLAAVRVRVDTELESRRVACELGYTSAAAMLSDVLPLTPGEAAARVQLAQHLGPRRTLTGEALEPAFPLLAAAVDEGQLSTRHAEVITRTITRIPNDILNSPVLAELVEQAEPVLVEHARTMNPTQLARPAHRLQDCLDPDGRAELERAQERRRELVLTVLPDGSGRRRHDGLVDVGPMVLRSGQLPDSGGTRSPCCSR